MRQTHFSHQIVEFVPERLDEGVLYVSQRYGTVVHKCACGCGGEVVTPLSPADWSIQLTGDTATLHPSIGNWSFVCQSHYFIRRGRVVWAGQLSRRQIERGRAYDREARQQYFEDVNHQKVLPHQNFLNKGWAALKHWWNY